MAKYTINYACGHGTIEKELYGPGKDRTRKIDWMQDNMVCSDCYKKRKIAEDAEAPRTATVCLIPAAEPVISIEVSGQIETNKAELKKIGYRWSDSTREGLFGYLSMSKPKRALTLLHKVETVEETGQWLSAQAAVLANINYTINNGLNAIDMAYLAKQLQDQKTNTEAKHEGQAALAKIKEADPRPKMAPLSKKIIELEKEAGGRKWNRKIYGRKGNYNFYINGEKYTADDAEVAVQQTTVKAVAKWDEKYKDAIKAAN